MSLDALSSSGYHETVKGVQNAENKTNEVNVREIETHNINITETPTNVSGSSGKQYESKQEEQQQEGNLASEQQIKSAIAQANNKLKYHKTRCEFSYHEATKRVSIKVIDKDTDDVIREIPPEETLEMVEKMWELAGMLIDEKR